VCVCVCVCVISVIYVKKPVSISFEIVLIGKVP
jgi:hypothetical protein